MDGCHECTTAWYALVIIEIEISSRSTESIASAIDIMINGPPVYCRVPEYEAICTSSTVLTAITWTSSILSQSIVDELKNIP